MPMSPPPDHRSYVPNPADSIADATFGAAGQLLTEAETARLLGVSPRTLRHWRRAGRGPVHVRLGGMVRYAPPDVEAFIAQGRRTKTSSTDVAPERTDPLQSAGEADPAATPQPKPEDEPGLDLIMRAMIRAQKMGDA